MPWVPPGTVGKYRMVSLLGRGGMGEVWKAHDPSLDRHVAVKLMLAGEHASEEMLLRFQREARLAAKLEDPGVVRVYDAGVDSRLHYFVMELVDGRSLKQVLESEKLTVGRAVRIAIDVARALAAAHELNIVHRDVKPGNIMIDAKGRVRVTDFGLAKDTGDSGLTGSGAMVGTPNYMAPEQAAGQPVSARTDIYSLGVVLYEMIAGRPPFTGTPMTVITKLATETAAPLSSVTPLVAPGLNAVVMRALAREPAQRYASAEEFATALSALPHDSSVAPTSDAGVTKVAAPTAVTVPAKRSRVPRVAIAAVAAAAALAAVLVLARGGPSNAAEAEARVRESEDPALDAKGRSAKLREAIALLGSDASHAKRRAELWRRLGRFARAAGESKDDPLRAIMDRLASNPLRFGAAGAVPVPAPKELADAVTRTTGSSKVLLDALRIAYSADGEAGKNAWARAQEAKGGADGAMVLAEIALLRWRWESQGEESAAAMTEAMEALSALPETPDRIAMRAIIHASRREPEAVTLAERLLAMTPDSPESHHVRALVHQGRGEWALARAEIGRAYELDANHPNWAYGFYIDLVMLMSDYSEGREAQLRESLGAQQAPLAHLARAWLGAVRMKWDDVAAHMEAFERTRPPVWLALEPGDLHDLAAAGRDRSRQAIAAMRNLYSLGRGEDSIKAGREAVARAGSAEQRCEAQIMVARGCVNAGRVDEAFAEIEQALKHGATRLTLEAEGDFASMLKDARWEELLKKYKR